LVLTIEWFVIWTLLVLWAFRVSKDAALIRTHLVPKWADHNGSTLVFILAAPAIYTSVWLVHRAILLDDGSAESISELSLDALVI
jgi:hypothetical protein